MKPLVYIAAPFTSPDPMANTHIVATAAAAMIDQGLVVPFVPHLSLFWNVIQPRDYEWWLEYDLDVISRCDGLLRFAGESPGADREVDFAERHGKPVFLSLSHCYTWARRWSATKDFASTHAVPS